jgi:hypothetical protein
LSQDPASTGQYIPGKNGGRLRPGGKPGHRGGPGRPPDAIRARCAGLFDDHVEKAVAILESPKASHGDQLKALDLLGKYGGRIKQTTEMQGSTIADVLRHVAEADSLSSVSGSP